MTMFMSLVRLKNVCSFAVSLCVPMPDPLRFVDVIVILLAVFYLCGFILKFCFGHGFREQFVLALVCWFYLFVHFFGGGDVVLW